MINIEKLKELVKTPRFEKLLFELDFDVQDTFHDVTFIDKLVVRGTLTYSEDFDNPRIHYSVRSGFNYNGFGSQDLKDQDIDSLRKWCGEYELFIERCRRLDREIQKVMESER